MLLLHPAPVRPRAELTLQGTPSSSLCPHSSHRTGSGGGWWEPVHPRVPPAPHQPPSPRFLILTGVLKSPPDLRESAGRTPCPSCPPPSRLAERCQVGFTGRPGTEGAGSPPSSPLSPRPGTEWLLTNGANRLRKRGDLAILMAAGSGTHTGAPVCRNALPRGLGGASGVWTSVSILGAAH